MASMQNDPIAAQCSELMREGKMPTATEIRAGKVSLLSGYSCGCQLIA